MSTEFSIIVPIYRAESYLRECLDSLLAQTFQDFELILVDDGSPDGCPAICDEYAAKDARISVIHKENAGVTAARKTGLERATGRYICLVDSDDTVMPDWLEKCFGYASLNGYPDMLIFGIVNWNEDGSMIFYSPEPEPGHYDKERMRSEIYPRMLYDRGLPYFNKIISGYMCTKIFKRELLSAHYFPDEWLPRIKIHEDVCLVYNCLYHADSIYVCPECFYYYRIHGASATHKYYPNYIRELKNCSDYLQSSLGCLDPDLSVQISAYITMRIISTIVQEMQYGGNVFSAYATVKEQMNETGIAKDVVLTDLPLYIRVFFVLLKCRAYFTAVVLTRLRMAMTKDDDE